MNNYRFYDTSSLLLLADQLQDNTQLALSSITLGELEGIKSSASADEHTKYCARRILSYINEHFEADNVEIIVYNNDIDMTKNLPYIPGDLNNDKKIIYSAIHYDITRHPDEVIFVTNDIAQKLIANTYFGFDCLESVKIEQDNYTGYIEVYPTEEELIEFYENSNVNRWNALVGQYVVVKNSQNEVIDLRCWDGSSYRYLSDQTINSKWFGKLRPMNGDIYQKMAFDCLHKNQLTVLRGSAGVGKSLIGLAYLFHLLETYQIDKIYVFCNPVATKDSAKLGLIYRG